MGTPVLVKPVRDSSAAPVWLGAPGGEWHVLDPCQQLTLPGRGLLWLGGGGLPVAASVERPRSVQQAGLSGPRTAGSLRTLPLWASVVPGPPSGRVWDRPGDSGRLPGHGRGRGPRTCVAALPAVDPRTVSALGTAGVGERTAPSLRCSWPPFPEWAIVGGALVRQGTWCLVLAAHASRDPAGPPVPGTESLAWGRPQALALRLSTPAPRRPSRPALSGPLCSPHPRRALGPHRLPQTLLGHP